MTLWLVTKIRPKLLLGGLSLEKSFTSTEEEVFSELKSTAEGSWMRWSRKEKCWNELKVVECWNESDTMVMCNDHVQWSREASGSPRLCRSEDSRGFLQSDAGLSPHRKKEEVFGTVENHTTFIVGLLQKSNSRISTCPEVSELLGRKFAVALSNQTFPAIPW